MPHKRNTYGEAPIQFTERVLFRYEDRAIQLERRITLLEARHMDHGRRIVKLERDEKETTSLWSNQFLQIAAGILLVFVSLAVRLMNMEQARSVVSWLISGLK